jgi:hypothetical protein
VSTSISLPRGSVETAALRQEQAPAPVSVSWLRVVQQTHRVLAHDGMPAIELTIRRSRWPGRSPRRSSSCGGRGTIHFDGERSCAGAGRRDRLSATIAIACLPSIQCPLAVRSGRAGVTAWRSRARAGSRRPTQTCLRCRTGISSATPRALLGADKRARGGSLAAIRSAASASAGSSSRPQLVSVPPRACAITHRHRLNHRLLRGCTRREAAAGRTQTVGITLPLADKTGHAGPSPASRREPASRRKQG